MKKVKKLESLKSNMEVFDLTKNHNSIIKGGDHCFESILIVPWSAAVWFISDKTKIGVTLI